MVQIIVPKEAFPWPTRVVAPSGRHYVVGGHPQQIVTIHEEDLGFFQSKGCTHVVQEIATQGAGDVPDQPAGVLGDRPGDAGTDSVADGEGGDTEPPQPAQHRPSRRGSGDGRPSTG